MAREDREAAGCKTAVLAVPGIPHLQAHLKAITAVRDRPPVEVPEVVVAVQVRQEDRPVLLLLVGLTAVTAAPERHLRFLAHL